MDLLGPLVEGFKKSHLSIPATFDKDSQKVELKSWLKDKFNNVGIDTNYTILRRGILEGIKFWKEEVEEFVKVNGEEKFKSEFCLLNKGIKELGNKRSCQYITSLFNKLPKLLPFSLNKSCDCHDTYFLFLKELSSEWEIIDINLEKGKVFANRQSVFCIGTRILKLLRNFTSHDLITSLSYFKEESIAFFFMVAMRSLLKSNEAIYHYEHYLSQLFKINRIKNFNEKQLKDSFDNLLKKVDNFDITNERYDKDTKSIKNLTLYWNILYSQNIFKDSTKRELNSYVFYHVFWQEAFNAYYSKTYGFSLKEPFINFV